MSAAARSAALDSPAQQRAACRTQNGANRAVTAIVDAAADQRTGDAADQDAGGAVRAAALVAAVVTLPIADAIVGTVIALRLVVAAVMAAVTTPAAIVIGEGGCSGQGYCGQSRRQDCLVHCLLL